MWSDDAFMAYKSGIYEQVATPASCSTVNHAMLLVGKKRIENFSIHIQDSKK